MPPIWGLGFAKGHDADRKSKTKIFSQMVVHDVVSKKKSPTIVISTIFEQAKNEKYGPPTKTRHLCTSHKSNTPPKFYIAPEELAVGRLPSFLNAPFLQDSCSFSWGVSDSQHLSCTKKPKSLVLLKVAAARPSLHLC